MVEQAETFYYVFEDGHELPLLCFCYGSPLVVQDLGQKRRKMRGRRLEGMVIDEATLDDGSNVMQFGLDFSKQELSSGDVVDALSPLVAIHLRHPVGCPRHRRGTFRKAKKLVQLRSLGFEGEKQSRRMIVSSSALKAGDSVIVKSGVIDSDTGQHMDGWQGRVTGLHTYEGEQMVAIHWDSITLKSIPPAIIEACEETGMGWAEFVLGIGDVELAEARDTEQQVKATEKHLHAQYGWLGIGPEGRRIQQVVAGLDRDDEWAAFKAWHKHLSANLKLPFDAEVDEWQDRGPLRAGDKLKVLDINEEIGDPYGVLVDVKGKRGLFTFPLSDLAVLDENLPDYQLVEDYRVWFANR